MNVKREGKYTYHGKQLAKIPGDEIEVDSNTRSNWLSNDLTRLFPIIVLLKRLIINYWDDIFNLRIKTGS